jgi:hypothetical protein
LEWRLKLLTKLHKQLKVLKTETNFVEVIITCVDNTLAGRAINMIGTYQKVLEAQSRIGWIEMTRGYWSIEWQKTYGRTYQAPMEETRIDKNKRTLQMTRWQKKILQTLWGFMITLWTT